MPPHLLEAAAEAVRRRPQYTHEYGLLSLREAIAAKLAAENGINADPGSDILVDQLCNRSDQCRPAHAARAR